MYGKSEQNQKLMLINHDSRVYSFLSGNQSTCSRWKKSSSQEFFATEWERRIDGDMESADEPYTFDRVPHVSCGVQCQLKANVTSTF